MTCPLPRDDAARPPVIELSIPAIVPIHSLRDKAEQLGTQGPEIESPKIPDRAIPGNQDRWYNAKAKRAESKSGSLGSRAGDACCYFVPFIAVSA